MIERARHCEDVAIIPRTYQRRKTTPLYIIYLNIAHFIGLTPAILISGKENSRSWHAGSPTPIFWMPFIGQRSEVEWEFICQSEEENEQSTNELFAPGFEYHGTPAGN